MWSTKVFEYIKSNSKVDSSFSTYTTSRIVKDGMKNSGFTVLKKKGYGSKIEMLFGKKEKSDFTLKDKPWFDYRKNSFSKNDFLIIGGGLAGTTIANLLASQNLKVQILENEISLGSKASSNPAAIFSPQIFKEKSFEDTWYKKGFSEFSNFLNSIPENLYSRSGILESLLNKADFIGNLKHNAEIDLNYEDDFFKNSDSVYFPNAGIVYTKDFCNYLATHKSVNIIFETKAIQLIRDENLWNVFSQTGNLISSSENVIIANSYFVNNIENFFFPDLISVRGQVLILPKKYFNLNIIKTFISDEFYFISNAGENYILGSTFNPNEKSESPIEKETKLLLERVQKLFPKFDLTNSNFNSWVGFRGITKDHLPLVGQVPDNQKNSEQYSDIWKGNQYLKYDQGEYFPNLYMSCGHGSKGLLNSFLSAKIIVSMITGNESDIYKSFHSRINPIRFLIKDILQINKP